MNTISEASYMSNMRKRNNGDINIYTKTEENKKSRDSEQPEQTHALAKFLLAVFEFQIVVKMYHFQTSKYSVHKTVDEYSGKLAEKMDKFFEIGQGIYGSVNINQSNIKVSNVFDGDFNYYINKFQNSIEQIEKIIYKHSDLSNIKDEIKGDLNQLKYLLTFS